MRDLDTSLSTSPFPGSLRYCKESRSNSILCRIGLLFTSRPLKTAPTIETGLVRRAKVPEYQRTGSLRAASFRSAMAICPWDPGWNSCFICVCRIWFRIFKVLAAGCTLAGLLESGTDDTRRFVQPGRADSRGIHFRQSGGIHISSELPEIAIKTAHSLCLGTHRDKRPPEGSASNIDAGRSIGNRSSLCAATANQDDLVPTGATLGFYASGRLQSRHHAC